MAISMWLEAHCWPSWMNMLSNTQSRKTALSLETLVAAIHYTTFISLLNTITVLQTRQLTTDSIDQEDLITAIDSSDFLSLSQPRMSIAIPPALVRMFSNMSGMGSNGVRLGSFLYANVTGLFPGVSLQGYVMFLEIQ